MATKDLTVRLLGDASNLNKALAGIGNDVSRTGAKLTKTLTPAAAAVGVAMGKMGSDFNDARDAIIKGTGASGAALDGLLNDTKKVAGQVPQDFGTVGVAIAELNTRLGLTGDELQDVAKQALDFSRVTGVDVESAVRTVSRTMKDWGVETENASDVMDLLYKASQTTGIGVDTLGDKLVQFGAPLRQIGFSMEESTALLAGFEAQGVNTELVMGGLRQSLGRMARAGEEPAEAFGRLTDEIKNTASEGEATALAMDLFGARAGPDMAAAIREGRFEIEDMVGALSDSAGSVEDAANRTLRFSDRLKMLRNRITGVLGPFGEMGGVIGGAAASIGPLLFGLGQMAPLLGKARTAFSNLSGAAKGFGAALGVATAALVAYNIRQGQVEARNGEVAASFAAMAGAAEEEIADRLVFSLKAAEVAGMDAEEAFDLFASTSIEAAKRVLDLGDASDLSAEQQALLASAVESQETQLRTAAKTTADYAVELDDATDATEDLTDATEGADKATRDIIRAHKDHERGLKDAARAAEDAEKAARDYRLELVRGLTDVHNHEQAVLRLENSVDEYRVSAIVTADFLKSDASDSEKEKALRNLRLEQIALTNEVVNVAAAYAEEKNAVEGSQEQVDLMTESLRRSKEQYPELAEEIDAHIARLNSVPGEIVTDVRVNTQDALNRIQGVVNAMNAAGRQTLGIGGGGPQVARKSGGPVPGSKNEGVPILAHGGEYVLDAGTVDAIKKGQPSAGKNTGSPSSGGGSRVGVHIEHAEFNNGTDVDTLMRAVNLHLAGV